MCVCVCAPSYYAYVCVRVRACLRIPVISAGMNIVYDWCCGSPCSMVWNVKIVYFDSFSKYVLRKREKEKEIESI